MSKTAELDNKSWMGNVLAEPLSRKCEPAKTPFKKKGREHSSERALEQPEAILLFCRNARKTDCILTLGCATPLPRALLSYAYF